MKRFYVDLVRGERIALLVGPFASEEVARKYVPAAFGLANKLDPLAAFDLCGVVAVSEGPFKNGLLNDQLEIEPGDLLEMEESDER